MYGGRARPPYSSPDCAREQVWGVCSMNKLLVKLMITAAAGSLLCFNATVAQILPPQKRAEHVEITKAPELESANSWMAIVRWITTNPRGNDEHYGVVHYGTDPEDLTQTARGHIRVNRAHPETVFRVRLVDLKPQMTYYYKVTSVGADGESDGVEGPVSKFTTPAPGEVINNYPQPR
jgi:hypothetical protein